MILQSANIMLIGVNLVLCMQESILVDKEVHMGITNDLKATNKKKMFQLYTRSSILKKKK